MMITKRIILPVLGVAGHRMYSIAVLVAVCFFVGDEALRQRATVRAEGTPAGSTTVFRWGANGHSHVQVGHIHVPVARQLDLVGQLGATWYRCDWYEGGWKKSAQDFDRLVHLAAERGIQVLPVVFPQTSFRSNATPGETCVVSATFAKAIASWFRGRIPYWELDNEMETTVVIRSLYCCSHKGLRDSLV